MPMLLLDGSPCTEEGRSPGVTKGGHQGWSFRGGSAGVPCQDENYRIREEQLRLEKELKAA